MPRGTPPGRRDGAAQMVFQRTAMSDAENDHLLAILTEEQVRRWKAMTWKAMTGESATFPITPFGSPDGRAQP